ncbi:hypothetical protein HPB49_014481 [Dermacentor silvarum]|uniref:Uncharacterized protein n=1 Tax=Dermacentor silvarum TaxID=543639 RepID=A0ACB8CFI0_DERSI|nr:hypothetical protein HPB49_014481 [Dermacentor silvarum]
MNNKNAWSNGPPKNVAWTTDVSGQTRKEATTQPAHNTTPARPQDIQVRGESYLDVAVDSTLLVLPMKMNHGLTSSALDVLFGVHRTSASRIFYATMDVLYVITQRSSDTYVVANSGLNNLLEPGDMAMVDKCFPHGKCDFESKDVTLVMPPFAKANQEFTKAEGKEA